MGAQSESATPENAEGNEPGHVPRSRTRYAGRVRLHAPAAHSTPRTVHRALS